MIPPLQVQYQVTCRSTTPHQMCLWLQAFVDTCTKDILGIKDAADRNGRYNGQYSYNIDTINNISGHCFTRTSRRFGPWCVHSHSLRPLGVGTLHFGISSARRRLVLFATCCIVVYKTIFPPALTASIVTEDSTRIGIVKS